MNPLTEEELNELAQLVPELSIEWVHSHESGEVIWVSRRNRDMEDTHPAVIRAWELIGTQYDKHNCADKWKPRYRVPRPGVLTYLRFVEAIHDTLASPRFPD